MNLSAEQLTTRILPHPRPKNNLPEGLYIFPSRNKKGHLTVP
jgi:hypothetical protein